MGRRAAATPPVYHRDRRAVDPRRGQGQSWYAGLTGKAYAATETALRVGVLLPAVMVAVTLRFGLGPAAAIGAGLITGLLERPPLVKPRSRVVGLAVAVALGFALSMFARVFSDGMTEFGDLPMTGAAAGVGLVLGLSAVLVRKVVPFLFAVAAYLLFDGPARIGLSWEALVGVGLGTWVGWTGRRLPPLATRSST